MSDLVRLSAVEMARLVRDKQISPRELVDAHLAQAERLQPHLNAFATLDTDGARRQAQASEQALIRGDKLGPLHGVPLTIKNCIDVAGFGADTGSRLRREYIAAADAPLVARLRAAGAIILGTTNTPEFLMAYETDNLLRGRTSNPWDLARTAGGSSGGESAAIAACCSAGGVGSDGGGSIRVPAHFTGICGLKPTPGRIPATSHFPQSLGPFARLGVVGPMARTVADLEVMLRVMSGPDPGDVTTVDVPLRSIPPAELRRLRIGYFEQVPEVPVTPETRQAVRQTAEVLEAQGFEVVPFQPKGLEKARDLWWNLFGLVIREVMTPVLAGQQGDLSPLFNDYWQIVSAFPPITTQALLDTWMERDQLRLQLQQEMQDFPVLLCPVCAVPAFPHGQRTWQIDGVTVRYLREPDVMTYTQWFNLLTNPGAVVPVGCSPEDLPIAVQVVGRPYEEPAVLGVAAAIESTFGWQEPPLSRSLDAVPVAPTHGVPS